MHSNKILPMQYNSNTTKCYAAFPYHRYFAMIRTECFIDWLIVSVSVTWSVWEGLWRNCKDGEQRSRSEAVRCLQTEGSWQENLGEALTPPPRAPPPPAPHRIQIFLTRKCQLSPKFYDRLLKEIGWLVDFYVDFYMLLFVDKRLLVIARTTIYNRLNLFQSKKRVSFLCIDTYLSFIVRLNFCSQFPVQIT